MNKNKILLFNSESFHTFDIHWVRNQIQNQNNGGKLQIFPESGHWIQSKTEFLTSTRKNVTLPPERTEFIYRESEALMDGRLKIQIEKNDEFRN